MARLRLNFTFGTVFDNPLTISSNTFNSFGLAAVPTVTAPDYMAITLDPAEVNGLAEVIYVTAHTAGSNVATVIRGQEGSQPRSHASGEHWHNGPTAYDFGFLAVTPDATSSLTTDFNGNHQTSGVILAGSFIATATSALIEVDASMTADTPDHALITLFVGIGVPDVTALQDGTATSAVQNVSTYSLGKVGGSIGQGAKVGRDVTISNLTIGQKIRWEIRYRIVPYVGTPVSLVGNTPSGGALMPDGTKLYITTSVGVYPIWTGLIPNNSIDLAYPAISLPTTPRGNAPSGAVVSPDGTRLYVANTGAYTINIIDTDSESVINSIDLFTPGPYQPTDCAISPDGNTLWVACAEGHLLSVSLPGGTINSTPVTGGGSQASKFITLSPDGTRAVVCNQANTGHGQIVIVNTSNIFAPTIMATLDASGQFPCKPAFESTGLGVWIPITDINQVKRFNMGLFAFDPTAPVLSAVTSPTGVNISTDGSTAFTSGSASSVGAATYATTTISGSQAGVVWSTNAYGASLYQWMSKNGFVYLAQGALSQVQPLHGGQLWCRASAPSSAFWGEYAQVSIYGGH